MERIYSIDFLKFFAAFGVVLIHANSFQYTSIGPWDGGSVDFVLDTLSRFAVPFFFMVSGYFFGKKIKMGKMTLLQLGRQVGSLLKLYAVWTFFYMLYDLWFIFWNNWQENQPIGKAVALYFQKNWTLKKIFYFGNPTGARHLWFLTALIWSLIIIFFFFYFHKGKLLLWLSLGLNIFGVFAGASPLPTRETVFMGLFYTVSGVWIALAEEKLLAKFPSSRIFLLIPVLLAAQVFERIYFFEGDYFLSTIPLTWLLMMMALTYKKLGKEKWITQVGANSIAVYLLHWFFLKTSYKALNYFGWNGWRESIWWGLLFPVFLFLMSYYSYTSFQKVKRGGASAR